MSPETAVTNPWRTVFTSANLALVAIDEAHCIAEWLVLSSMKLPYRWPTLLQGGNIQDCISTDRRA